MRIELTLPVWKTEVLPLNYARALAPVGGLKPPTSGLTDLRSNQLSYTGKLQDRNIAI